MASSAKFLEEALSTDVDESAVSAIVGSLENQLEAPTSIVSCQQISATNGNQNHLRSDISKGDSASTSNHETANGQVDTMSLILNSEPNKAITDSNHQQGNITSAISNCTVQGIVSSSNFVNQVSNVGIIQSSSASTFVKTQDGLKTIRASNQSTVNTFCSPRVTYSMQNVNSLPNGTLNVTSTPTNTALNVSTSIIQGMVSQTFPQSSGNNYQKISPANVEPNNKSGTAVIIKPSACNNVSTGVSSQMTTAISLSGSQMNTAVTVARPSTTTGAQTTLVNNTPIVLNLNALRAATPTATGNRPTTPQRVMIPNTLVRAGSGQPGITLQTLQGINNTGQQFLVKTENGQFHIVRLTAPPVGATNNTTTIPAGNYRFTVPVCNATAASSTTSTVPTVTTQSPVQSTTNIQRTTDNSKEKCRKFLTNLLELSSKEPKAVEKNVRTLIQELIDSKVEPEEFCDRLEKLLNASPQPCLIGFLRRSLPGLRAAMTAREMSIEGIRPPPAPSQAATTLVVAAPSSVTQVNNQVRPILGSVQQVRITLPQTPTSGTRPQQQIQHRIITPVRIPAISGSPITGVKMVTTPTLPTVATAVRIQTPLPTSSLASDAAMSSTSTVLVPSSNTATTAIAVTPTTTNVRFTTPRPNFAKMSIKSSTMTTPTTVRPSNASASNSKSAASTGTKGSVVSKSSLLAGVGKQHSSAGQSKAIAKEKKTAAAATAASTASTPSSASGGYVGDDDVNDVAAMAGVNLAEESQRILGPSEFVGTQIRSCKDETFLHTHPLTMRIQQIVAKHGLEEPNSDVVAIVSHAVQERLKNIIEKLNVIAEHRVDFNKADKNYEISHDIRRQLRCLEELDKVERKRHDEMERELLLRAAKSRSKSEDPEQVKLKAKAKELQRAEMEELRQREANMTALQAIGPRKKIKLDSSDSQCSSGFGNNMSSGSGTSRLSLANRPRLKRVTVRDFLYVMEKEKQLNKSPFLYKSYLK